MRRKPRRISGSLRNIPETAGVADDAPAHGVPAGPEDGMARRESRGIAPCFLRSSGRLFPGK
jgi:hypothetical protein